MGLALVVLEEDAGRAMQLADNDAFRTVDDERALFRHQRNFAHVNIVFTDFLDRAGLGCFAVIDLKTDLGAKAAAIGQAAELAFGHVEFRLGEFVIDELQARIAVVAQDRENGRESSLKPHIDVAGSRSHVRLQEVFVGTKLDIKQGRHFKDARARGKALADALLFSERVRHGHSVRH